MSSKTSKNSGFERGHAMDNKMTVLINGITLTRAQVEAAMAELNTPVPQPMVNGTVIMPRSVGWSNAYIMLDATGVLDTAQRAVLSGRPFVGVAIPLHGDGMPRIASGEGQRDLATDMYWQEAVLTVTAKKGV